MTGHTPGPWKIAPHYLSILGDPKTPGYDDQVMIADCEPSDACTAPSDQQEANARLIAASPDLLAALNPLMNCIWGIIEDAISRDMDMGGTLEAKKQRAAFYANEVQKQADDIEPLLQKAQFAIAKAEGKTDD